MFLSLKGIALTYVDHMLVQHAGEIGFISFGVGRTTASGYSFAGLYGVDPSDSSKASSIETFTLRQTFPLFSYEKLDIYFGLNIFHPTHIRYRTEHYGEAPNGYYPIGAIRGLLNLGLRTRIQQATFFYLEGGLNDVQIVNWVNNLNVLNPINSVSLGLGYGHRFD